MKIPEGMKQSEFNQLVLNILEENQKIAEINQKINDSRWGQIMFAFKTFSATLAMLAIIRIWTLMQ